MMMKLYDGILLGKLNVCEFMFDSIMICLNLNVLFQN